VNNRWNAALRLWPLVSLASLALACNGGIDNPSGDDSRDITPVIERDTCEDNPLLAGCDTSQESTDGDDQTDETPDVDQSASELELARAAAENVLRANCGQCHGPQLSQAAARAGMNFIDDIDELVNQGKIVPLDADNSPVVVRMREGSMPPLNNDGPRPSTQDIETVAEFVNNPLFWPEYRPAESCDGQGLISFDDLYQIVSDDVRDQDDNDRRFMRYVTLTNRYNAGICADNLDKERFAIIKLVNMLSTRPSVTAPTPIDGDNLIYRLDIRDYDWDRDVNGFQDGWEAIINESPYAIPFVGDQADDLRDDTETDVPIMNADALLDVAALGDLYYGLIDVDPNQSLDDFVANDLGIDVDEDLENGEMVRAGTTRSAISREDRVVERHDLGVRRGFFWRTFDFSGDQAGESIFANPFGFNQGGAQAIFTLPNGLLGFIIADENDNIVEETNLLLDTFQDDFVARTSVSCSNCHAQGFNPVVDEVRPFVEENRRRFNREDFEGVTDVYLSPEDFAQVIEADSASFREALAQADLPTTGGDPVAGQFLRFNDDVDLKTAAGELGVTEDDLSDNLNLLDPRLIVLREIGVEREDFSDTFAESLCIMQLISNNAPDPDLCDQVVDN
jgi:mono/diheme cytochrome c family protein